MDREDVIKKIRKGLNESLDNENIFRIADLFIAELEKAKREARVEVAEEIKEAIRENNNE